MRSLALNENLEMVSRGNNSKSGNATIDGGEGDTRTSQDTVQSGLGK